MVQRSFFDKNIERFAVSQPKIAYRLPYHDNRDVIVCSTRQGEPNLCKKSETSSFYLHSPSGALREAKGWFAHLKLDQVEVLYVFGVGLGYAYKAAKRWLHENSKRHLVFLEDDLSVLSHLFEMPMGATLLKDPQVTLRYSNDLLNDKELSDWLCWDFLLKPIVVTAFGGYARHRKQLLAELRLKLPFDHHRVNEAIDEYLDHGISYFRNFYANVLCLHESYFGDGLFGKFKNVPAVICGAGPSLDKVLQQLGSLGNKALIIAGGSATNALTSHAVQPHFAAGVDPNSQQYQRYVLQSAYEVPFFYRQRLNHTAFGLVHGPKLYLSGSGGYDIASWFEACLGLEGQDLDEGHNVINLCTSITEALGCNPIIFVGLDLAYTGMKAYAPGVTHTSEVDEKHILSNTGIDKAAVVREDIYGQPIYTLWKWIAESEWLGSFASEHPETTFVNATEGGLGIPGVPNQPFYEIVDQYLQKEDADLRGDVWKAMQKSRLPADAQERLSIGWIELEASLRRCVDHFETILAELKALWIQVEESPQGPVNLKSGLMALTELELEDEVAYRHVLDIFNEVYIRSLNREIRQLKASNESWQRKQYQQLQLETRRCAFLKETAVVNLFLMQEALQNHQVTYTQTAHKEVVPSPVKSSKGAVPFYYADGSLAYRECRHNGVLHGPQEYFYPNTSLKSLLNYQNGLLHGEVRLYYATGQPRRVVNYVTGKRHGIDVIWFPNEKVELEAQYEMGQPTGTWRRWYSTGIKAEEIVYHTSPEHYDIRKWNEKGVLQLECVYEGDVCRRREWDAEGNVRGRS